MVDRYISQQINKAVCNAFGCSEKATKKIEVSAGTFGKITLHVCRDCIGKFQNRQEI
jgi:hypothetical protein